MTGKKYSERNLNRGKVSWIFKILLVIFSGAVVYPGCSKRVSVEDNNIININFVYVADNNFPSIQHDQIRGWLEKSKYFFKQALGINLVFKDEGVIRINNFFDKYFDPSEKEPGLELFRILPDVRGFNRYDKDILSIMKREDLQTLNRVIFPSQKIQKRMLRQHGDRIQMGSQNPL